MPLYIGLTLIQLPKIRSLLTGEDSVLAFGAESLDDAIDGLLGSKGVVFVDGFRRHLTGDAGNAVQQIAQQLNR